MARSTAAAERSLELRGLQLERMITLAEASQLTGLSVDSLRRHYAHLIRHLSPRRLGMKLRDVLEVGSAP
jgi:hypothetical protein